MALYPLTEPSVARDYLATFSAFEGVVSCMDVTDLIAGRDWKRIERLLRDCVDGS